MLKIGITGGIGSGKSTICSVFEKLGVPIFNADIESKKLVNAHPELISEIKNEFGNEIYDEKGNLNTLALADIVFKEVSRLQTLNSIIHPRIKSFFLEWCDKHSDHPYVIKEAAILFESGTYKDLDKIILVYAPEQLRIDRVMKRDNVEEKTVKLRIEKQMDEEEKKKKADFVIYNDESQLVLPQVLELHQKFSPGL